MNGKDFARVGTAHRIVTAGNHAQPMSSARRDHIHGRLVPMDRPEGEPSLLAGTLIVLAGFAGIFGAVELLGVLL